MNWPPPIFLGFATQNNQQHSLTSASPTPINFIKVHAFLESSDNTEKGEQVASLAKSLPGETGTRNI